MNTNQLPLRPPLHPPAGAPGGLPAPGPARVLAWLLAAAGLALLGVALHSSPLFERSWPTMAVVDLAGAGDSLLLQLQRLGLRSLADGAAARFEPILAAAAGVALLALALLLHRRKRHSDAARPGAAVVDVAVERNLSQAAPAAPSGTESTALAPRLQRCRAYAARHPGHAYALLALRIDAVAPSLAALQPGAADELHHEQMRRLHETLPPGDAVVAADRSESANEFVVVVDRPAGGESLAACVARLHGEMAEAYTVQHQPLRGRVCIGVVEHRHLDSTPAQALDDARLALNVAASGGDGAADVAWFDPELRARRQRELAARTEAQRAIDAGEIEVVYEPVVTLTNAVLQGVRAEARWRHAQRGLLLPPQFFTDRDSGSGDAVIAWHVMRTACRQQAQWRSALGPLAPRWVGVPVSREWMADGEFVDTWAIVLATTGLDAADVELIFKESLLTQEMGARTLLPVLREQGARLALAGIGSSSASLSILSHLPVSAVTIERDFVVASPISDAYQVLIKGIVGLTQVLGMSATAEGVATAEQRDSLLEVGVELGQGPLFAPPMPAAEFERWLQQRPPAPPAALHRA